MSVSPKARSSLNVNLWEIRSVVTENRSAEKEHLSAVETVRAEMSGHVKRLASPSSPGESVKACIRRAASRAGMSFGQIKRCWYGEWRVIPAHVADQLREASAAHDKILKANLLRAVAAMQTSDPEFYRNHIEVFGQLLADTEHRADPAGE